MSLNQDTQVLVLQVSGALTTSSKTLLIPAPFDGEVVDARAYVGTSPAGAALKATVKVAGTVEATLTVADGAHASDDLKVEPGATPGTNVITTPYPDSTPVAVFSAGDTLQVAVSQVGSSTAGSDIAVVLTVNRK